MQSIQLDITNTSKQTRDLTLWTFASALFLSAALMFGVQPMFARMVLPILGGSPGVWSVAMVFFQLVLLLGYLYAHLLTRFLPIRIAGFIHFGVLLLAFLQLPIAIASGWGIPPQSGTAFWLIGLFAASIGLPFFALSGNGPLLQAWFSKSDHPQACDPYFLYGASNLGSFCGLLLYPIVVEPIFRLSEQTRLWMIGFVILSMLIIASNFLVKQAESVISASSAHGLPKTEHLNGWQRYSYMALAFVPSGFLVAVTAQISTDVASAPFLWVLPLGLFLLTFVFAFKDRPLIPINWLQRLQPIGIAAMIFLLIAGSLLPIWLSIAIMLAGYFLCALLAHSLLYHWRPASDHLTEFYLYMSLGGVLGGIFTALLAPLVFRSIAEYPILLVAALLCLPAFWTSTSKERKKYWLEAGVLTSGTAIIILIINTFHWDRLETFNSIHYIIVIILCSTIVLLSHAPGLILGSAISALMVIFFIQPDAARTFSIRSFFGLHRVVDSADGRSRLLFHGTTIHGGELLNDANSTDNRRPETLTYYYPEGTIAQAINGIRTAHNDSLKDVAVVGLGSGALACLSKSDENWRFFEIDPEVAYIANGSGKFNFISRCAPNTDIVLGDARLTLAKDDHLYDAIILDAFSSDSIPVHLLTVEALEAYRSKLKPGGELMLHITNRHMDLAPIVATQANAIGMQMMFGQDLSHPDFYKDLHAPAKVVVLAQNPEQLIMFVKKANWQKLQIDSSVKAWTDDYANILQAIWRHLLQPAINSTD